MKRLMILLGLIAVFVFAPMNIAQDDISDELLEDIRGIETATSELRELDPLYEVTRLFPPRDELLDYLIGDIEAEYDEETLRIDTQFYLAFDFVSEDFDIMGTILNLLDSQVAGFYDPDTQEMYTLLLSDDPLGDSLPILERITYSHEYVHALQDQHFDLNAIFDSADENNVDQLLAIRSLIEGDATAVMNEYMFSAILGDPELMAELLAMDMDSLLASTEPPEGTPTIFFNELTAPYLAGSELVIAVHDVGGWEAVNAMYDNLPQSTEQIFHPERYISGEMPVEVTVADALDALAGDNWELLTEQTLGEFYWREYLATQLNENRVNTAMNGWGGDRYHLYYNAETEQRAWVMNLVLDSGEDADNFTRAYLEFIDARMGAELTATTSSITCWEGENDAICFEAVTQPNVTIATAPTVDEASALVEAQVGNR